MRLGKLTSEELRRSVLDVIKRRSGAVINGAAESEDCASFKTDDEVLVSSDPITAAEADVGGLAVIVNCNDIAAAGGVPFAMTLTLILPPDKTADDVKAVMEDAEEEAARHSVEIIGGHTEFSDSVTRVIAAATVFGTAKRHKRATACSAGNRIIMTKSAALEGTYLLAQEYHNSLTAAELAEAQSYKQLLSVCAECGVALQAGAVSMHDATEGGVLGAIAELAQGAKLGATIYTDKIPVTAVTQKLAALANADPLRLIASGSLIITATDSAPIIAALAKIGVKTTEIGILDTSNQVKAVYSDRTEIIRTEADQLFNRKSDI